MTRRFGYAIDNRCLPLLLPFGLPDFLCVTLAREEVSIKPPVKPAEEFIGIVVVSQYRTDVAVRCGKTSFYMKTLEYLRIES